MNRTEKGVMLWFWKDIRLRFLSVLGVEKGHYIASIRSGDSSARIWTIGDGPCNSTIQRRPPNVLILNCYDGCRELVSTLNKNKGPIISLMWNKKGNYLLSGSPLLDVAWQNNDSFATSSADNMIYVCKVGENKPVKTFSGHQVWSSAN
ncbi:hypothetical protein R3W88_024879 [Solanum pinnatisectum]|uniref:Uncharacterized protein n=1 Tax=Solanum pinnatisectum TaxID=50273 RepID=A0AAV9M1N7_9SOLN|nr:hypothetical protein R3W88_024879 [Solanum pinnatisectum]